MSKHPLDDDSLDRGYAIEMVLWRLLSTCQDVLIERRNPDGIEFDTIAKLQRAVAHWRENPDKYLKHPAWIAVKDTDSTTS